MAIKLKNLTNKQPKFFSRTARVFIYSLGFLVIVFLVLISYFQNKMYHDTIKAGVKIRTSIINIDCANGRTKSRLYFKNSKNQVKHVNVNRIECEKYKAGDTIFVYEKNMKDWYEIVPLATENK